MLSDEERKSIAKQFFQKAISKNLIINTKPTNFSRKTNQISKNVNQSASTYVQFKQIFDDPQKLNQFITFNHETFQITEENSQRLLLNFFVFHALNYLETYKLILLEMLKPGEKIGKRKKTISLSLELGSLIVSLSQELKFAEVEKLFPILFRNILGHSSWWWEKNTFAYDNNGTIEYLTLKEFSEQMEDFGKNMQVIIDEYLRCKSSGKLDYGSVA